MHTMSTLCLETVWKMMGTRGDGDAGHQRINRFNHDTLFTDGLRPSGISPAVCMIES